ncbi:MULTISPECIES: phage tail tape measure protein [Pseudomonas]|uniref:phage tail tape measure protein n=1 Tax=Pseudomonas TaxID=286 RepID=UPI00067649CC|nr:MULTISPECIES: phage tail tape measure protein [Pseudomonas]QUN70189.1 phage tail tape measure protein [Pseudomonas sp. JS425]
MNQTSRLSIEIDSRNAEQKASDVKKALNALEDAGLSIKPAMDRAGDAMGKAGESAKGSSLNVAAMERQVKSLSGVLIGLAGPLAAAFSVQKIAAAAQQYADLTNRLRLVTDGTAQLAQAQNDVLRVAQASRQSLESTSTIYQRIAQNGRALGLSFADVAKVTETVAKSVAMSGASAASADAALVQFGQALASGVLRGEELNSILEQTPALAQTIARGLGVTVGQLRAMGAEGQLTSEKVIKAIENQKDAVDKLAASMQVTVSQAMTAFTNSLTTTIGKLDEATGASSRLAAGILGISEAMDRYRSGEFMDFFTADKKTVEGFNNEISTSLARLRDLDQVRSKLNKSDPSDTVFFNFKFYNKQELDAEIAGLNSNIGKAQAAIKILQKSSADLSAQAPKGEAAAAGLSAAAKSYTDSQQKALAKLQDNSDAVKEANRYISEHTELTEADKAAILSNAYAAEAQKKANKAAAAATREANKAYQENAGQKMLDDARQRYAVLMQQKSAIDDQGKGARTLGVEAKKLIELETEIAQLKEKKTLTAAQKQVLAMADLNLAQQKQNAALEQANKLDQQRLENAAKLLSFQDQLNDSLETEQQGLDSQIAGLGSGSKLQARIREDLKIRQDYQKQLAKLQRDYQRIVNPTAEQTDLYEKETKAVKDALGQRLSMQEDYYKRLDAAQSDWAVGANDAWYDYLDEASDISGQTYDLFSNTFHGIEDAIAEAARSGKLSFKDLADSIIADLARMAARAYVTIPLLSALGLGGSSAAGLAGSVLSGGGGGGMSLSSLWNAGSGAYSAATSGFGSAVTAGWNAGQGFLGGMQGAISGGYNYISNGLSGLFSSGAAAGSGSTIAGYTSPAFQNWVGAQQAAAYQVSGLTQAMAGIGGAIYGYGQSGLKGAVTGGLGGWGGSLAGAAAGTAAGTYIGGTLGSVLPGIGTAIGAALGSYLGGSLFGGSWQTKDVGLSLGVTDGEFIGRQFEYQKKKGGLFGKNKKRTRYSALDPETQEVLDNTYDATIGGVESLFEQLNVSLNDGVLDGLDISDVKISTKDKTTEEIQKELDTFFGDVAQKALNAISDATGSGISGVTVEQLTAFVNNLYAVNGAIKHLNIGLYETSIAGGKLAEQLAAAAGGLDVLTASAATYYDAFYTDTEKAGNILSDVREQFAKLNLALPETREGYRGLIESLDKSTESGRNAIAAYLNLSGAADQMYDILEASAAAAKAAFATALSDAVSGAMAGVQRAVAAQRDAISKAYTARTESLNDMLSTAQRSVTDLNGVSSTLEGALKSLRGTSDDAVKMLRSQAQATLEYALTVARKGGSISGIDGLSDAISTISSNNTDRYASLEEYLRDQGRATNLLGELEAINGKQLSNAEKTVKALESQLETTKKLYDSQISALDDQLALAQGQIDAINGVDNSVKSVADAVLTMSDSILATLSLQNPGAAAVNTYENNEAIVKAVYRSVLGRDAEAKGLADWAGALSGGLVSYQNLVESITREARANGEKTIRVPGFASGGDFGGGIRLVGERGPELELTGRSRIFNAQKTADMLMGSGGGAASEIRALREEMKAALFAIAKNTFKAAKNTDLLPRKLEEELFA